MRKLVVLKAEIRPDQDKALRDKSKETGAPITVVVRRALDNHLGTSPPESDNKD